MRKVDMFTEYKKTGISRAELLEIMKETHSLGLTVGRDNIPTHDLMSMYVSSLTNLDIYINNTTYKNDICAEEHIIKVNILTRRQMYLSDVIFEYIIDYSHVDLPKIYHEIYDYVYDYGNQKDDFNYAELLLLQKMVKLLLKKIKNIQ